MGLLCNITFFVFIYCYFIYFIFSLVKTKLEHESVVWNSVTATAAFSYRHCCIQLPPLVHSVTATGALNYRHCCIQLPPLLHSVTATGAKDSTHSVEAYTRISSL
jgi:hypothetical protein